jgi:hypothetical protein
MTRFGSPSRLCTINPFCTKIRTAAQKIDGAAVGASLSRLVYAA